MSTLEDLQTEVKKIVDKIAKKDPSQINPELKIFEDLDIDSLRGTEMLTRISQKFKIFIPDGKLGEISTVGDTLKMIKKF